MKATITTSSTSATTSTNTKLAQLVEEDERVGWPADFPEDLPQNLHGWFRDGNVETLTHLVKTDHTCVIELGSWLGLSTRTLLQSAPNAVVFAVDIWLNEYFLTDSHYDKNDKAFSSILNDRPIYHQFLANTKEYRAKHNESGEFVGLIPMKMKSTEALGLLKDLGVKPDLIYIDASHHYDYVVEDVTMCLKYFPDAMIVGDDWDNLDVRRAVKDVALDARKEVFVHLGTCWTFEKAKMQVLVRKKRQLEDEEEMKIKRQKVLSKASFADLLKVYKK